jgi:hypothetical protein
VNTQVHSKQSHGKAELIAKTSVRERVPTSANRQGAPPGGGHCPAATKEGQHRHCRLPRLASAADPANRRFGRGQVIKQNRGGVQPSDEKIHLTLWIFDFFANPSLNNIAALRYTCAKMLH